MTDLVKRLRDWEHVYPEDYNKDVGHLYEEAADRIEKLEAQQQKTYQALLKVTKIHDEVEAKLDWVITERDETFALMLDRAQTAETKLAKAVEALGVLADDTNWFDAIEEDGSFYAAWRGPGAPEEIASAAIAKAKGGE